MNLHHFKTKSTLNTSSIKFKIQLYNYRTFKLAKKIITAEVKNIIKL